MTTKKAVGPIPEGYHAVTPFVIAKDAVRFLEFMTTAFGARELGRVVLENGKIGHAEARIGDSVVMTFDAKEGWAGTPAFLRLYVDDCDVTYQAALDAGGTSVTKPGDMPWNDRASRVRDPLGNLWWIMTHLEDVSPEEEQRRYGASPWKDALADAQNAQLVPGKG